MAEVAVRVQACAAAGVDVVFLVGLKTPQEIEALSQVRSLLLLLGAIPQRSKIALSLSLMACAPHFRGIFPFLITIRALYETYKALTEANSTESFKAKMATQEMVDLIWRADSYERWLREYLAKE